MLTVKDIEGMAPASRLLCLEELSSIAMPGASNAAIAASMGFSRRAYQDWKAHPHKIPTVVLLLLQEWGTQGNRTVQAGVILADVCSGLQGVSERLSDAARMLKGRT